MSRKGVAIDMSTDHKPEDESELSRIEKAGGAVVDGRVQVKSCSFPSYTKCSVLGALIFVSRGEFTSLDKGCGKAFYPYLGPTNASI